MVSLSVRSWPKGFANGFVPDAYVSNFARDGRNNSESRRNVPEPESRVYTISAENSDIVGIWDMLLSIEVETCSDS